MDPDNQDTDHASSFSNPWSNLDSTQNPTFYNAQNLGLRNDLIWPTGLSYDHDQHNYFANVENSRSAATSSSSLIPRSQSQPGPFQSPSGHAARPDHQTGVTKNPKKRVRASHRAPTTVLRTDAANFRQMVQEFTGFPATSLQGSSFPQGPASYFGPIYPVGPSAHTPLFPSLLNTTPMADYVASGGANLGGSATRDLSNNYPQHTIDHLSNQMQDHSIPTDSSAATEEMGNSEK